MALQLLKRNYVMQGYERPKILKNPQGEERWAPRRVPVDVGDVMMNIRMDSGKNKYINEHVSKYSQGLNPYGQWGYPYKVNKQFRPPIFDPRHYEALSRMPVKFDSVTAGPIVKSLYQKKVDINNVAPKTIINRVCPSAGAKPSQAGLKQPTVLDKIELTLKQPHASAPFNPSFPTYQNNFDPSVELDPKVISRVSLGFMGVHAPFDLSDQTQTEINDLTRRGPDLAPKVNTSAWYNPSYNLGDVGWGITNVDTDSYTREITPVSGSTNVSWINQESERGQFYRPDSKLNLGGFNNGGATIPTIQPHLEYNRTRDTPKQEFFMPTNAPANYNHTKNNSSRAFNSHINDKLSFSFDTRHV